MTDALPACVGESVEDGYVSHPLPKNAKDGAPTFISLGFDNTAVPGVTRVCKNRWATFHHLSSVKN
jgi:hypothetical protein